MVKRANGSWQANFNKWSLKKKNFIDGLISSLINPTVVVVVDSPPYGQGYSPGLPLRHVHAFGRCGEFEVFRCKFSAT